MNYEDYKNGALRTMPNLGNDFDNMLHMALGMSTEAGEILDTFKKTLAYGKELDVVNIKEEVGDIMWYLSNLLSIMNIDFEDVLETNANKLLARYPDGFSKDKALNRDLELERSILERS